MSNKLSFLILFGLLSFLAFDDGFAFAEATADSDQQINDFSLSGYEDKGKKTWDIAGKSADIFTDIIKLKDITGNMYGQSENIKLTALNGDFNKAEGRVHLENDVVITTSSGTKLTTDSLDWDRKNNIVTTEDKVNIAKENMVTTARGAKGLPGLSRVDLKKDVVLEILPENKSKEVKDQLSEKIVITCDGPLSIDYEKNIATFNNNVKVDKQDSQIYSDTMEVYFNRNSGGASQDKSLALMSSKIDKIFSHGNVRIIKGENVSYSDEAVYSAFDKKVTLTGRPKLVLYSTEGMSASLGN